MFGIVKEFRDFAIKGNMIDMAVGIIIGGAFGTLVNSLVGDILKPPLDYLVARGQPDPAGMKFKVGDAVQGDKVVSFFVDYGKFINAIISFFIVALAVFLLVKAINTARRMAEGRKEAEAAAAPPPADVALLTEIRDLLKARS